MGCAIASFAFMPPCDQDAQQLRCSRYHIFVPYDATKSPPTQRGTQLPTQRLGGVEADEKDCVSTIHFTAAPQSPPWRRRCVLFAHGNAEDLSLAFHYVASLRDYLMCDAVAFDYCGYGLTVGPSNEKETYRSAEAVFSYVTSPTGLGFMEEDVVLIGRSLGSGPATELAVRHSKVAALVLLSALTSCASVASKVLGVVTMPFDIFRNESKLPKVECPILIVHGTADKVVPFKHAESLLSVAQKRPVPAYRRDTVFGTVAAAAATPGGQRMYVGGKKRSLGRKSSHLPHAEKGAQWARLLKASGCGHNDIESRMGKEFYSELRHFMNSLVAPAGSPGV